MKKGFCAGTFDPITVGHVDLIERAAKLCDHLTVGVLVNQSKNCMFTLEQRKEMVEAAVAHLDNVDVVAFEGHLAKYAYANGFNAIFRGLRNKDDFDYELQLSQIYASYADTPCETVYLMTNPSYSFISSTVVRENFRLDADVSNLVKKEVLDLMNAYKNER